MCAVQLRALSSCQVHVAMHARHGHDPHRPSILRAVQAYACTSEVVGVGLHRSGLGGGVVSRAAGRVAVVFLAPILVYLLQST